MRYIVRRASASACAARRTCSSSPARMTCAAAMWICLSCCFMSPIACVSSSVFQGGAWWRLAMCSRPSGSGISSVAATARAQPVGHLLGHPAELVPQLRDVVADVPEDRPEPLGIELKGSARLLAHGRLLTTPDVVTALDAVVLPALN